MAQALKLPFTSVGCVVQPSEFKAFEKTIRHRTMFLWFPAHLKNIPEFWAAPTPIVTRSQHKECIATIPSTSKNASYSTPAPP